MGYIVEVGYVLAVVLLSRILHGRFGVSAAITRKLVHILIAFVFPIQYHFFKTDALGLLIVPSLITVTLFLVARFSLIPAMVNPKNRYGIFYYAAGITALNVISVFYPAFHAAAGAAVFCLAFGDGAAALLSGFVKNRHPLWREKSVEGTLFCFVFSVLGMLLLGVMFRSLLLPLPLVFAVAALTAVLELFCGRLDNLAILAGVALPVALLAGVESALLTRLLFGVSIGALLVLLSVWRRMLTVPAAVTAFCMLLVILAFGGYSAAIYIVAVYAVCGGVHLLNKKRKNRHSDGARGLLQVVENGGIGTLALLLYGLLGHPAALVAYYAAIAEFFTDTLASDIGTLSRRDPIDLCRLRRIPRGRSGGVSLLGTVAALCGAALCGGLSLLAGLSPWQALTVAAAATVGMLFDSVLGSLLQAKYRCTVCGTYTERAVHCGARAEHTGGLALLKNGGVNLLCTLLSAAFAALLCLLLP